MIIKNIDEDTESIEYLINQTGLDKDAACELLHKNNGDLIQSLYEFNNIVDTHNDTNDDEDEKYFNKNTLELNENHDDINNKFKTIRKILDNKDQIYNNIVNNK